VCDATDADADADADGRARGVSGNNGFVSMRTRAVLVYDGDCGFCTQCVRVVERMHVRADIVAWQFADLDALGLTQAQASDAVQWIEPDGTVRGGHEAVAAALMNSARPWWPIGRAMLVPGVSWVAARVYRLVADNRHRLPGGTAACALPPEQRPGSSSRAA
jgi:predicted DCC family thiol-disulfide oxidoreductase YuxK